MLQAFRNKTSVQGVIQISTIIFVLVSLAAIFFLVRKQKQLARRIDNLESIINNPISKINNVVSPPKNDMRQSHAVQTSKAKRKPENVVCEGGVCRIQKPKTNIKSQPQKPVNNLQAPPQFNPLSILMQTIPLGIPQNIASQSRLSPIDEHEDDIDNYVTTKENLQKENEDDIEDEDFDEEESDDDLDVALEEELKDLDE